MIERRPIKISINALGGQGGGVLANWIVKVAEAAGFIAQLTSVPGVAQRTGATIYYLELFPEELAAKKNTAPILALMPAPGDVDIVLACELMEAGRAMMRGFVTDRTTLIASRHRTYAVSEKIKLGDGRETGTDIIAAAEKSAGRFILADMESAAAAAGAVISAVMFGALAGSRALPIERQRFEEIIRKSGRSVDENLNGFEKGFAGAQETAAKETHTPASNAAPADENGASVAVRPLLTRMKNELSSPTHFTVREGLKKLVDYQDIKYADLFLDRLVQIHGVDKESGGDTRDWRLTRDVAQHLSLWMAFEDTIRVADLKTRSSRFVRFREDVRADEDQIIHVSEYMHPRIEEICDLMPAWLGATVLSTPWMRGALGVFLKKGRRIQTTKLHGFLLLNFMGSLKFMRRASLRYKTENTRIIKWLQLIEQTARDDYALACEVASLQRLIKGYGETHARGLANFATLTSLLGDIKSSAAPADALASLKIAALADEDGIALKAAIARLKPGKQAA